MKKSIFKSAIASAVILASSQSFAASDTGNVTVYFNAGTFISLAMTSTSINLSPTVLTGSASGCAYSSTATFSIGVSSANGGTLTDGVQTIPYTLSGAGTGTTFDPTCSSGDNVTIGASVTALNAALIANGSLSDTVTVTVTTI